MAACLALSQAVGAQTVPALTTPATAAPATPWNIAVGQLRGKGLAALQIPRVLFGLLQSIDTHTLKEDERQALNDKSWMANLTALRQQISQQRLDLDRKLLSGTLTAQQISALKVSLQQAQLNLETAKKPGLDSIDLERPLVWVWPKGKGGQPWSWSSRDSFALDSNAQYLISGEVHDVGDYLDVTLWLYSVISNQVLADWHGQMAHDEVQAQIISAADRFREYLWGRPWSSLTALGPSVAHFTIDGVVHALPWQDDELSPGTHHVKFDVPGLSSADQTIELKAGEHRVLSAPSIPSTAPKILVDSDPQGAFVYADSQFLGPAPQEILRPKGTVRVRVQSVGWETSSVDLNPSTPDKIVVHLEKPYKRPSVASRKDSFYWSLAVFSASLTSTAFLGAWSAEQVQLTNAYVLNGSVGGAEVAYARYQEVTALYATGVVLTSAVFVWMMFELADYLDTAQTTLP